MERVNVIASDRVNEANFLMLFTYSNDFKIDVNILIIKVQYV